MSAKARPRFYFALPRLCSRLAGGSGARAAQSSAEAHFVSILIFSITVLVACRLAPHDLSWGVAVALPVAAIVAAFLFWLVALFLNSIAIRLCQPLGIFRRTSAADAQSIFIVAETSAFAFALVKGGGWSAGFGAIWIASGVLNLLAVILLALIDDHSRHAAN